MLHAQIYTTSSAGYKSVSGGGLFGTAVDPAAPRFRSTSTYIIKEQRTTAVHANYTPVQIQLANGSIRTAAAAIGGGELAHDPSEAEFIPTNSKRGPGQGGLAPPDTPIGDSWQVWLIMLAVYTLYLRHKQLKNQTKNTEKSASII